MCGIAGFWRRPESNEATSRAALKTMTDAIDHRGPDGEGAWMSCPDGIALGHRRLSILDLSPAGAQPMTSHSGRYVIIFNGEIYNHLELRRELGEQAGEIAWMGHSDTETLLFAIESHGIEVALDKATGMFALAVWDRRDQTLTLARDRMGEKPLYYAFLPDGVIFASELKALLARPEFPRDSDPAAVEAFLRFSYVPEPLSIFSAARKLLPGSYLVFRSHSDRPEPLPYWSLCEKALEVRHGMLGTPYPDQCDRIETELLKVVRSQLLSDVPIGCFLSGGIDSSLTAALMQAASGGPIRTFSIGFEPERFSEAAQARRVATHLGTKHTEFVVTEADALALIPDLSAIFDEPFADSSQLPTVLLSRLARREVTVALTGDGGDEIFGGYNRYYYVPEAWKYLQYVPDAGKRALGRCVRSFDRPGLSQNRVAENVRRLTGLPVTTLDKISKVGDAISGASSLEALYSGVAQTFDRPEAILQTPGVSHPLRAFNPLAARKFTDPEQLMILDSLTYLPGDILVKVDRAAMSASLETRTPFLDRRIVELAWQLPIESKLSRRIGKRILKDILDRHVPRSLTHRPKQGFAVPLNEWLRGALRPWAESLMTPESLSLGGLLETRQVRALWNDFQTGKRNDGAAVWNILMMQAWLARNSIRQCSNGSASAA